MNQGSGTEPVAGDVLAMTSLASRQDLAPRVRQLLEGILGLFYRNLERAVATALDEFERSLVQQANKPRAGEVGQRCLETVRRIKPTRADLVPRFMLSLEDDLSHFDKRVAAPAAVKKTAALAGAWQDLSLVGSSDLDETVTLREMALKVEARNSVPLYELGYRFGVLAGRSAFDVESLPLGPGRITAALRYAAAALDLPLDHRILFYQTFERVTMSGVGALYTAANAQLAEQGILKHLQLQTLNKPRPTEARPGQSAARAPAPAPPRPRGGTAEVDLAGFGLAVFEVETKRVPGAAVPPPRESRFGRQRVDLSDADPFTALRNLLGTARAAHGVLPAPRTADAFEPGPRDVQSALAVLQVRSPPTIMLGGKVVQRTVAQLRQDLLNQLRQVTPAGQTPRLADEDSDTIDLAGALFEQLLQATRANGRTQSLLTRLQVPILRAALRDRRFFTGSDDAARTFLNLIAETGTHWLDDAAAGPDPVLAERMQRAIDRITSEYDTDVRVFDQAAEDVQAYVQSVARKAEVSERRLVEACRGREKLAVARDAASRAITIRLASNKPSRLVRTLLEQAWTDVLALTLLRQGEKSEPYRRQLAVADQLIAAGGAMRQIAQQPIAAAWREEIESGLTQVGYHGEEVQAVITRLFAPERLADDDNAVSQTDLAIRLKSKMRLGEAAGDDLLPAHPQSTRLALSPEEAQMLEQLKAVPFGTWFEIVRAGGPDQGRIRLSWSSPLTMRCLLTNRRGARIDERGLEQLARDLVAGKLRFAEPERETLVSRCWRLAVEELERAAASGQHTGALPA